MEASSQEKLLRLKIASELVLGSQAAVAFSRAFYLENLLIERILNEFQELFENCHALLNRVNKFMEEVLDSSSSSDLSPITESSIRCQCSEILGSLEAIHQPTLESFQQKLIQAKARRQAKSCLLEKLSAQSNNYSSQFNTMTLNELINEIHIPEFSWYDVYIKKSCSILNYYTEKFMVPSFLTLHFGCCVMYFESFINDSDFGVMEKLVEEWDQYRATAKVEMASHATKIQEFQNDIEGNRKMREYTCDMILAQITQQKQDENCGTDTLKKKGVFHKFSTLLRKHSQSHHRSNSVSIPMSKNASPTPSRLSVAAGTDSHNNSPCQETF